MDISFITNIQVLNISYCEQFTNLHQLSVSELITDHCINLRNISLIINVRKLSIYKCIKIIKMPIDNDSYDELNIQETNVTSISPIKNINRFLCNDKIPESEILGLNGLKTIYMAYISDETKKILKSRNINVFKCDGYIRV